MNKRLKYDKYRDIDNIITIDLHDGYTIIAIIGKNKSEGYDVQLMLRENSIDKWELIEDAEHLIFNTNYKTIYSAILKKVAELLEEGFFNYYIQRCEYDINCANIGNEIYENERLGGLNVQ